MKPETRFLQQPKKFWANIRTISQHVGYTAHGTGQISVPSLGQMFLALHELGLKRDHIVDAQERLTAFGRTIADYFQYRAHILNSFVEPSLMDAEEAKELFSAHYAKYRPKCPIPMNKQKGDKKAPAYFTGIINCLVEANSKGFPCDFEPRELTTITLNGEPLRTLARWVDGAFPAAVNPIAVWEIKEYYYTTTFGSRVADGVYESLLDGMELEELREHEGIHVKHYLMVDSHLTWWEMGKSYLCRLIDMLHMGYVDEVLFGKEVIERLPVIVQEWVQVAEALRKRS